MHYLKATDEATFNQALVDAGWSLEVTVPSETEEDSETTETHYQYYTATHSLDVIGTIYVETGNTLTSEPDADGNTFEYAEMEATEGYHANLLLHGEDMPEALAGFEIEAPATPYRKFA